MKMSRKGQVDSSGMLVTAFKENVTRRGMGRPECGKDTSKTASGRKHRSQGSWRKKEIGEGGAIAEHPDFR